MTGSIRRRGTVGALVTAFLLAALIPATAAAAGTPITFSLDVGSSCVGGGASAGASLKLVWKAASGTLKASATVQVNSSGRWSYCASEASGKKVRVGDYLKGTVGAKSHALRIPKLSLFLDREADVYRGDAPAGSVLRLVYFYESARFHPWEWVAKVTAASDDTWSYLPDYGVTGGDFATMRWRDGHGDKVFVSAGAPFLDVTLDKAEFSGATSANTSVRIAVRDGVTSALRSTGTAITSDYGGFGGRFRNSNGDAVALRAGDHVIAPSIASDADWIVPEIEGTANAATDVVSGRCSDAGTSAGDAFVFVYRTGIRRGYYFLNTEPDGSFVIDFRELEYLPGSDPANLKSGDRINVRCYQTTGDTISMNFRVP